MQVGHMYKVEIRIDFRITPLLKKSSRSKRKTSPEGSSFNESNTISDTYLEADLFLSTKDGRMLHRYFLESTSDTGDLNPWIFMKGKS
jgi:hypothetical protein